MAQRRLPSFVFEYLAGGAEEEASLHHNRAAFAGWRFAPRSLADVSNRDLSIELFGQSAPLPFAIAPTGLNGLFWPHADTKLAEAAAHCAIPFAQSTMSNDAMSNVAAVKGLRHWWQLYVFGPPDVHKALIRKALECGCEALVITTDAQIYGNREWDQRNRIQRTSLTWRSLFDTALHVRWLFWNFLLVGMPEFPNILPYVPADQRTFFKSAYWVRAHMDLDLTWTTIAGIRNNWPRRLIIKGLLRTDDIRKAKEIGADAVVISNHGGRQLDWTVAPLDVLPEARATVGDGFTIIVDGGIRRGTDIVKALALGADAVLIGRATLYGVAAAGRSGALRAIDILREEIDRTMGLLGVRSIKDLGPHLLVRASPC